MKLKIIGILVFIFVAFALVSPKVFAHGTGQSVEKTDGDFTVDVGYDSPNAKPVAGEQVRFDFRLFQGNNRDAVNFSDIWVKFAKGSAIILAGRLARDEFIPPGILMTFPQGGDYELTVRFNQKDSVLVETTFPLQVQKAIYEGGASSASSAKRRLLVEIGVIVLVSVLVFWLGGKWRAKKV